MALNSVSNPGAVVIDANVVIAVASKEAGRDAIAARRWKTMNHSTPALFSVPTNHFPQVSLSSWQYLC